MGKILKKTLFCKNLLLIKPLFSLIIDTKFIYSFTKIPVLIKGTNILNKTFFNDCSQ